MGRRRGAEPREYVVSAFLDDERPDDLQVFLVLELVQSNGWRIGGIVVRGSARLGWTTNAYGILERRREYGDVGDHSLLTEAEASAYLARMGLKIEDGERLIIDRYAEVNGSPCVILPADPVFEQRLNRGRARVGLPPKP